MKVGIFAALILVHLLQAHLAACKSVKVAVIEAQGFCMIDKNRNWFGLVPDIVRALAKELQFDADFHVVDDGRYGSFDESTGSWNGLIGKLTSKKADMAAAALTATHARELHIDFSHEFLDSGLSVMIKKPDWTNPITRSAIFFLSVFDAGVWAAVILIFVLTSFLVFLNDRYNPREFKTRQAEHNSRSAAVSHNLLIQMNDFSLFGSLFYIVSTGCFQGYRRAPQSLVGRSLSVFWWIFVCMFSAAYMAGLLCALVASRGGLERQFPIHDLAVEGSSVDSSSFKGFVPVWIVNGSTHKFFQESSEPVFQMIYNQYKEGAKNNPRLSQVVSVIELIKLIKDDGKYFGVVESVMADYFSRESNCEFLTVGSLLNDRSYAFAFPQGSNLTRQVNEVLLRLRESGFVHESYRKHFLHDKAQCSQLLPPESTVTMSLAGEEMAKMFRKSLPITLRSFSGPIIFYFLSLLASAAVVLADIFIYTRYERYMQGSQPFQNAPEQHEADEPSFGALTFSDDQRLATRAQET